MITITDLEPHDTVASHTAAELLLTGFAVSAPEAWPHLPSALEEVEQACAPGNICRAARAADGSVVGWIGGRPQYAGNVWEHIQHIRNLHRHPFTFYQKCGFTIVGVVPDANGFGKPDILMAKRVAGTR